MNLRLVGTAGLLACSFLTLANAQGPAGIAPTVDGGDTPPNGVNVALARGIRYHGGPVMGTAAKGPVHLYLIFYGNWTGTDPGGPGLMQDFCNNLGGSPYWNMFTTYNQPAVIQNALTVAGTATDAGSQGVNLTDASLKLVVKKWIANGTFPLDLNGIYLVLTSEEVNETSGFCTAYCGFHNHMTLNGVDVKYSFIGNPAHCTAQGGVADCQGDANNVSQSPNNDPGVDAMISVIAHEAGEAVTDPALNAWYFLNGQEEGDKCAYKYGTVFPVGNGSDANITLGGKNYLVQQSWIGPGGTAGQKCALSYP